MNNYRLIQFTLLVRIDRQLHEFNFLFRKSGYYEADTVNLDSTRYYFKMVSAGSQWKLEGENIPAWIKENEIAIVESLLAKHPAHAAQQTQSSN